MRRKETKAWIRILEVFIAILIVMGTVLIIMTRNAPRLDISDNVYEKQRQILKIVSKNDSLRAEIIDPSVSANNPVVNNAIDKMLPNPWSFATNICELDLVCSNPTSSQETFEKDVYATEVIITSNLTEYSPKKLRFFVWVE
tara:strand:+ start:1758 stop:2183 length:426 start_codon:yes stop_codon:yes gene_type:complete